MPDELALLELLGVATAELKPLELLDTISEELELDVETMELKLLELLELDAEETAELELLTSLVVALLVADALEDSELDTVDKVSLV